MVNMILKVIKVTWVSESALPACQR